MSGVLCESQESRRLNASRSGGPALVAIVFAIIFLGTLSGMSLLHLGEEILGAAILTATVVAVALLVAWGMRLNRAGS
jgi:hypothetical protein